MNKLILWTRYLTGGFFCLGAFSQLGKAPHPIIFAGFLLLGGVLMVPPRYKVRGQTGALWFPFSLQQYLTPYLLLALFRWWMGLFFAMGGLMLLDEKSYVAGAMCLSWGLIFISPLDRFFFSRLLLSMGTPGRERNLLVIILRSWGVFAWFMSGIVYDSQQHVAGCIFLLLGAGPLLVSVFITPVTNIVPLTVSPRPATPRPAPAKPSPGPTPPKSSPSPAPLPTDAPAKKAKKEVYLDAYREYWTILFKQPDEQLFNQLIQRFQNSWLEAREYKERLRLHRQPDDFKAQTLQELVEYLGKIRSRPELQYGTRPGSVIDDISNAWKSDKRLRSLYNAMRVYCSQRGAKQLQIILPHVAEYRAIENVFKKIRRSVAHLEAEYKEYKNKRSEEADLKALLKDIAPGVFAALLQSMPAPPAVSADKLAQLNDETYFRIIDYIVLLGKNLENFRELNEHFNEERYRDYFLPFLNAVSPQYSAKGEAFNRLGKTDILVCDKEGNNLFVAECKLWKGEAYLLGGLEQLLNNYVNWRDGKTALIVFNQSMKQFSSLVARATEAVANHRLCRQSVGQRSDASWSYLFSHPSDPDRTIRLELIVFNFA